MAIVPRHWLDSIGHSIIAACLHNSCKAGGKAGGVRTLNEQVSKSTDEAASGLPYVTMFCMFLCFCGTPLHRS